jgi:hypothetical protein
MLRLCHRPTARASLIPLVLVAVGALGGLGPSSSQAAGVFTDISLPSIAGTATEGQTLSEVHATWSEQPAGYTLQWDRCNSSGNDCESISKATAQTYRLTAADVGFTIRVGESARNAAGAVTPTMSEPTAVVRALAASEHGGGSGGSGSVPPASCCETPAHIGAAEIKSLLVRQLAPSGKAASISTLLQQGGLRMSFKLPEAGALMVKWYLASSGRKAAGKVRAKPIEVAVGQARFTAAQTVRVVIRLTAQGRKLLRHAGKIHLEAKGTFAAKGEAAVGAAKQFTLRR